MEDSPGSRSDTPRASVSGCLRLQSQFNPRLVSVFNQKFSYGTHMCKHYDSKLITAETRIRDRFDSIRYSIARTEKTPQTDVARRDDARGKGRFVVVVVVVVE